MTERSQISGDRRHPRDGAWRAYIDGELTPLARLRLRSHVSRCNRCRDRLAGMQQAGERSSALLSSLAPDTDVREAWARLAVRSGRTSRRAGPSRVSAFLAGGLAAASVAASVLLLHPAPTRLLGQVHGADTFTTILDRCCSEGPDAVSPTGVFRLELAGMGAPLEVTYTDRDGSGTLSQGDVVRTITRTANR